MTRMSAGQRLCAGALALVAWSATMACTPADRTPVPAGSSETPVAAPSVTLRTIADSPIGAGLTITAVLTAVLSERSFIVDDVDLPDQGLLVLGNLPDGAQPRDLLTVRGVIAAFDFEHFATTYDLDQEARYRPFHDRKILVAHDVRSWA
jgi:hypothetical protein